MLDLPGVYPNVCWLLLESALNYCMFHARFGEPAGLVVNATVCPIWHLLVNFLSYTLTIQRPYGFWEVTSFQEMEGIESNYRQNKDIPGKLKVVHFYWLSY